MKQNYNLTRCFHDTTSSWNTTFLKNSHSLLSVFVFMFFSFTSVFGAVGITPANGTANSCKLPTDYVNLGNIVISEGAVDDFNIATRNFDYTLVLSAPTNFEFNPGVGSVGFLGTGDITTATIAVTSTTITITFRSSQNPNRIDNLDALTISGIQFRGINIASFGNITRPALTGGNAVIAGITPAVTNFGTLTSTNTPPAAIGGGAANVCTGANTPAFTNAVSGGTWSIIPGTGTASINASGIVTGLTAGTVTVRYSIGTCAPANIALNVVQTPGAIGGGAANICIGTPSPAFTNPNAGGTWSIINGTGSATISAGGVVTGVTTGTATVVYSIGSCTATQAISIITTPTITTNPTNVSITAGSNTSFTVVGSNSPTSYTWQVSTNGGSTWTTITNGGVYSNATTATLNITGATFAMNGYLYRASATNSCGTSSYSTNATLTVSLVYCTPVGSNANPFGHITNVNVNAGAINRTSTYDGYINTGLSTTLMKGFTYSLSIGMSNSSTSGRWTAAWADWNLNGTLNDAGENIAPAALSTISPTDTRTLTFTVPAGASTGSIKLRVVHTYEGGIYAAPTSCAASYASQSDWEDYTFNIIDPPACIAPTAQPTSISLTPAGTTIAGGFIAASPTANNYLVVMSTSATPPSAPVNGTSYAIGSTLAPGYTVIDNDTNTTFTATGLTNLTTYYFYIYSFNSLCTGGPLYLGTSPLTGNTTTTNVDYCIPTIGAAYATSTNHHIRKVEFIGTLQDITNISTFTSTAPIGYENYTGLAVKSIQAKGEGVNIYLESPFSGYIKAWVDWNLDGDFLDAGETVYDAGGTSQASTTLGFIVPTAISAGDYRVRLRISGRNGAGADAGFAWNSCSTNLAYYGETEDYILRVIENCPAKISTITNGSVCGSGSVTLNVTGTAGTTQFRWYANQTGGAPLATTATGTWNTPSISTTTTYWVTAFNGTCETLVRTKIVATVKTVPTLTFATSNTEVCGENSIVALTAGGDTEVIHLLNENFEGGLGTFSNVHYVSNAAVNTTTAWQIKTGPYVPTGLTWYPAISSNFGANNFAFVNSDIGTYTGPPGSTTYYYVVDNGLVSNTVNSTGFLDLTLKFRIYFDRYYPNTAFPADELMTIDVSTNGGTTWTALSGNIIADIGYGTRFTDYSYNLNSYINQTNLKVRVRYYTSTWANGAAVDDIELYGTKALNTAFQWSGTSLPDVYTDPAATTTPYIAGTPATVVYVKPTIAQLESGSYTFTATATLTNGCNVSTDITILNKSKIWKGTVDNNWYNANNWSPVGIPNANSCVIIPDITTTANRPSEINTSSSSAFGKYLTVKNNGVLRIYPNNNLTIGETVTVNGTGLLELENSANLVQINNVANTGNIRMKRNTFVRRQDYVYWSSPVAGFANSAVSPGTNLGYQYKWSPTTGGINNFGNWTFANETMVLGKGYCLRAPDSYSLSTAANYTATFVGVPNNGNITIPISRGTYDGPNYATGVSTTPGTKDDDNWNLVGNPYPSAINAISFLNMNTNIAGFVNIWTHGTLPSNATADPFYNDYTYNYTPADYITYNSTGASTPLGFNGFIGAGQGFFVSMLHTTAATTENLVFDNTLRRDVGTGNTYNNGQFFRTNSENSDSNDLERHRIWFDLVGPTGNSARALLGYIENATDQKDRLFDASSNDKVSFNIFSLIENDKMLIQGRKLPFDSSDKVNIGVTIPQDGLYKIAIGSVDGLFLDANQKIYLEDKELNVTYDLKNAPYTFMSKKGTINDRFILKFINNNIENTTLTSNDLVVYDNTELTIESGKQKIKNLQIYDVQGKLLISKIGIHQTTFIPNNFARTNNLVVVKVTLDDNSEEVRKIIF